MSKIKDYFAQFKVNGKFNWSENSEERDEIASLLFGAQIVAALDYWVKLAEDLVTNPKSSRKFERENALSREDEFYRNAFLELTSEEKQAVIALVGKTTSGALFSTLVALDQFSEGEIQIVALDSKTGDRLATIAPQDIDMHDRLYEWIEKFSAIPKHYESDF